MKSTKTTINSNHSYDLRYECTGHSGAIYALDADPAFIYTASADKFVTRWNRESGQQDSFAIRCDSSPFTLKLFNENTCLALGLSNGHIHLIDLVQRKEIHLFNQHKAGIFAMYAWRNQLFVGDADGFLSVWDTRTFKLKIILPFCSSKIRAIAPIGPSRLAVGNNEGEIIILDTEFMNETHRFYAHELGVSSLCFDPHHSLLISGGKDVMLRWWSTDDFQIKRALPAHKGTIYGMSFLNESHFVTVSRDKSIKIWDAKTQQVEQKIEAKNDGHRHSVNAVWSDQKGSFATVGDDQILRIFQAMTIV